MKKLNKRVQKVVDKLLIACTKEIIVFRKDQLKKAVKEKGFDYAILREYDEVLDIPSRKITDFSELEDYWLNDSDRALTSIVTIDDIHYLTVLLTYGYSSLKFYVRLDEERENTVLKDIKTISDGTMATLMKEANIVNKSDTITYEMTKNIIDKWYKFAENNKAENWKASWKQFTESYNLA